MARWELKPSQASASAAPDFTLQGFGASALGGEGQTVFHVTNRNDTGAGSFRSLVEGGASNMYIVFDVGGNFDIDPIRIGGHHITIDGSTAPSPGVTFREYGISFENDSGVTAHHIVVKNIRHSGPITHSVAFADVDNFSVTESAHDIAFHKVSSRNASDGCLDITDNAYNVTVQWSIIAKQEQASDSASGASLLKYGEKNITVHHCIFNTDERGPLAGFQEDDVSETTDTTADIVNNINWKWVAHAIAVDGGAHANVKNCWFQKSGAYGSDTVEISPFFALAKAYINGCIAANGYNVDALRNVSSPYTAPSVTTDSVADAVANVLAYAGCRGDSFGLDAADQAIVDDITNNGNLP